MILFLGGLALLVVGYFTYGRLVERIVGPDDRQTPAVRNPDGVDYVELPKWKNMLIQLLNIVGTGPVIGAVLLIGSAAMLVMLVWNAVLDPSILQEGEAFLRYKAETFDAAVALAFAVYVLRRTRA